MFWTCQMYYFKVIIISLFKKIKWILILHQCILWIYYLKKKENLDEKLVAKTFKGWRPCVFKGYPSWDHRQILGGETPMMKTSDLSLTLGICGLMLRVGVSLEDEPAPLKACYVWPIISFFSFFFFNSFLQG